MRIQEGSTMKLTKKVIAGVLIAGSLATILTVPQVSEAAGRHWRYGGGHRYHHGHHGGHHGPGPFWGGLAVGAVTGIVVGSIFAPRVYAVPPPVVYQPAPPPVVYQPVCSSYWVGTHWNGYQWVPGYWAQACR
jgi:hypothetical protein